MHLLHQHIAREIELTDSEFEECLTFFQEIRVPRKTTLIRAHQLVDTQYFVLSGCLRSYFVDEENDKEYTVQFAIENWWISDFMAYFSGNQAQLTVECIEDAQLMAIRKSDLDKLYASLPIVEQFFRRKLENAFAAFQKRILGYLHKTAEARYDEFLTCYPSIEQRARNYQIASYLGITPESLSRIRKMKMKAGR
ncbi:MAG: Crp/Fnr family transcriptional regulator [Flammeovirgaceae bacterium]